MDTNFKKGFEKIAVGIDDVSNFYENAGKAVSKQYGSMAKSVSKGTPLAAKATKAPSLMPKAPGAGRSLSPIKAPATPKAPANLNYDRSGLTKMRSMGSEMKSKGMTRALYSGGKMVGGR